MLKVTRLALMNSKLTQSLSLHNLATSFDSDTDPPGKVATLHSLQNIKFYNFFVVPGEVS